MHRAEVVTDRQEPKGFHVQKGDWEFTYDSGRRGALGTAVFVLGFGILLLLTKLLQWEASFWDILWPWALTVFGLFGILRKISFFKVGVLLFGLYFLLDNLGILPFQIGSELVFPGIVVLLGLSLLADALKKPKKSKWHVHRNPAKSKTAGGKGTLDVDGESFSYTGNFGEGSQRIEMPRLREGSISVSFGEFTVDFSGVEELAADCELSANCSFGELTVLVPKRFAVRSYNATSFAQVHTLGQPDDHPQGVIELDAHASFGEITVRYI